MVNLDLKIGISGVRGIVGDSLTPRTVIQFTRAFATLVGGGKIAVATDTRPSGKSLQHAVFCGLIFSGAEPVSLGILPTPSAELYVKAHDLSGGIVITASHSPDEWNGLKFIDRNGLFLSPFRAQNLLDIYHQQSFLQPEQNRFHETSHDDRALSEHCQAIYRIIDFERIKSRKFRVFCDPGGGVGALCTPTFLEPLGCRVTAINDSLSGRFPRNPEPVPENLTKALESMKRGNFDIGFVQDPDGDRLMVLDEQGNAIGGEKTLVLALDGFLPYQEKGSVVVNLSTSRLSEWICARHGFQLLRAPVGEINVTEMMLQEQAVAGGEGNGGIIVPAIQPCRDSFAGMALILQALSRSEQSVSEKVSEFPRYRMRSEKIATSGSGAYRMLTRLHEEYPDADSRDGLRVDRERYWFHVRSSNTEPVIRICAEGEGQDVDHVFDALLARIKELLP